MRPRSILVINVSRIGDTLLATPAIRAIAARWPEATVDVLGHPNRYEVLRHLPFVRSVAPISKKSAWNKGWLAAFSTKPYDLAFVYGFDQSLVRYALRVSRDVVAFRQYSAALNARLTCAVTPPPFQGDHAVKLALSLPAALDVVPGSLRLAYSVTPEESTWADATLSSELLAESSPRVGLQIASFPTKAYRDWPLESFIELARRIRERWPRAHFLILGGSEEHQRTAALKSALGEAATLYAGKLSLRQTGALISRLDLYVGVDTGPTHLASCFDIPMVGLYHGFSRSELIAPLEHPCFRAVDHPLAGPECSTDAVMSDISVDRVFEQVASALADWREGARQ